MSQSLADYYFCEHIAEWIIFWCHLKFKCRRKNRDHLSHPAESVLIFFEWMCFPKRFSTFFGSGHCFFPQHFFNCIIHIQIASVLGALRLHAVMVALIFTNAPAPVSSSFRAPTNAPAPFSSSLQALVTTSSALFDWFSVCLFFNTCLFNICPEENAIPGGICFWFEYCILFFQIWFEYNISYNREL